MIVIFYHIYPNLRNIISKLKTDIFISAFNRIPKVQKEPMSQTVNINFRMDAELKKNMEKVCADMGLTMTTAFTIFAKKVSREKRIPFELSADPFYSESNIKYLEAIMEDVKSGKAHFAEHDLIEDD